MESPIESPEIPESKWRYLDLSACRATSAIAISASPRSGIGKGYLVRSLPHTDATPIAQAESRDGSRYDVSATVGWLAPWIAADCRATEVPSL
jgi:hypothetical protein